MRMAYFNASWLHYWRYTVKDEPERDLCNDAIILAQKKIKAM